MISYYIEFGQAEGYTDKTKSAKFAFPIMSRTSFSSIFASLLTEPEQIVLTKLVQEKKILPALNNVNPDLKLTESSEFFKYGRAYSGKGKKPKPLTVQKWLESIVDSKKHGQRVTEDKKKRTVWRDLLSPPVRGPAAMGRFEVETEADKKDTNLVKFEIRIRSGNVRPKTGWVTYAEDIFRQAAVRRARSDSTVLDMTGISNPDDCADTYFEQKKQEDT